MVGSSTCDANSEVRATVQDGNLRRERIELTHELKGSSPGRSSLPATDDCWATAQPPSKSPRASSRPLNGKTKIQALESRILLPPQIVDANLQRKSRCSDGEQIYGMARAGTCDATWAGHDGGFGASPRPRRCTDFIVQELASLANQRIVEAPMRVREGSQEWRVQTCSSQAWTFGCPGRGRAEWRVSFPRNLRRLEA